MQNRWCRWTNDRKPKGRQTSMGPHCSGSRHPHCSLTRVLPALAVDSGGGKTTSRRLLVRPPHSHSRPEHSGPVLSLLSPTVLTCRRVDTGPHETAAPPWPGRVLSFESRGGARALLQTFGSHVLCELLGLAPAVSWRVRHACTFPAELSPGCPGVASQLMSCKTFLCHSGGGRRSGWWHPSRVQALCANT